MASERQDGPDSTRTSDREILDLYQAHYESLVRCALRLLDTRHLAEEAVQEAFLKYYAMHRRPRGGCEYGYLRSIALNNARSMMRRKQCAERWRPERPRVSLAVEDQYIDWDSDQQLRARCASLPERQRTVLDLRYWHGLSVAEVASELAISEGSVKTHASRGRAALRRQLTTHAA